MVRYNNTTCNKMQFTPQQLSGAGRYNSNTRIGNWNEDAILDEYKMKEYRHRKENGQLESVSQKSKYVISDQNVPLSFSADGKVRYGDYVMLQHGETSGTLCCDLWEETFTGSKEFVLSVGQLKEAVARNTFKIVPLSNQGEGNKVLKYGDSFRIMCNEALRVDEDAQVLKAPVYVKSCLKNDRDASLISGNQLVCTSMECNSNTIWQIARGDAAGAEKFLAMGAEIQISDDVTIVHTMTRQEMYANSKNIMHTDFGAEVEICCHSTKLPGKHHNLNGEASGFRTGDILGRKALPQNSWKIVMASTSKQAEDHRNLPGEATPERILQMVRTALLQKGTLSFRHLSRAFKKLDQSGNGKLDREDLKYGLQDFGIPKLNEEHYDMLLDQFDRDKSGYIHLKEFLRTLQGGLSAKRKQLIEYIYDCLDRNHDGNITLSDLKSIYNVSQDPRILSGEVTEQQVLAEFIALWDTQVADQKVTLSEFTEFFTEVSSAIADDDYFEHTLRNSWQV